MKLSKISINNYRSIRSCDISFKNHTILLGKNNEGKTNIIRAIKLCMSIISSFSEFDSKKEHCTLDRPHFYYYDLDYPLNAGKNTTGNTTIISKFSFDNNEISDIRNFIKNFSDSYLSIIFSFGVNNTVKIKILNKLSINSNQIRRLCEYISKNFDMQWIPAIRSKDDVYEVVDSLINSELKSISDKSYQKFLDKVENKRKQVLDNLAIKAKKSLQKFMPSISEISISTNTTNRNLILRRYSRLSQSYTFKINDGVLTSIERKGDGVISLTTIALLSHLKSTKSRLIIIDEPENHLHPDAIRYINNVMVELSKKYQVVISTHNPILINRNDLSSNIIVQSGKAVVAHQIIEIRKTLGVVSSDNLTFPEYVILVEGKSDQIIFDKLFHTSKFLTHCIDKNILGIKNIGGTAHLSGQIEFLDLLCSKYFAILDNDEAGRKAKKHSYDSIKYIPENSIRCISIERKKDSELEDLYNENFYSNILESKAGVKITDGHFKNATKKWSDRVNNARVYDHFLEKMELEDIKNLLANNIKSFDTTYFSKIGLNVLFSLRRDIINYLKKNLKRNS